MPSVLPQLFRRPPGSGWLILSGGPMPEEAVQRALALVMHAGSIVAVAPSPAELSDAEFVLQKWTDPSGWAGCAVDCGASDILEEALTEAAIAVLPDLSDSLHYARALGDSDACDFLLAALDSGAVIVAEGSAAEALGEEVRGPKSNSGAGPALRWLPGAVVQTHFAAGKDDAQPPMRKDHFRIGLPEGVSLALGPAAEREIWGEGKPTITFRQWWPK
ncbi:MAG: hypothetical protein JW929_07795 [Anaerolineales bacterium]|nr:hypothetical protein [Anaerolineales bacterium]